MHIYKTQDRPNPKWFICNSTNEYFARINKVFMCRDGINIILSNLKPKKVLIPAYICKEVVLEFEKTNCDIFYYDINPDFSISSKKIIELIVQNKIELFYHVIYFGIESVTKILNKLIKQHCSNVYIIEDRAHYLSNKINFKYCDAYVYSFRKVLPIPEGGGFITKDEIDFQYSQKLLANILPILIYLKKSLLGYNSNYNLTFFAKIKPINFTMPISFMSNIIIKKYDYKKEIEFRKQCYYSWIKKIEKTKIIPVFKVINDNDIPQGCPIFVKDSHDLQEFMKHEHFYLKRHWELSDKIKTTAPLSYNISKRLITLPIYPGITDKIQNKIIKLILDYHSSI